MPEREREREDKRNTLRALHRVKRFLERNRHGAPAPGELRRIEPDVRILYEKFLKLRELSPSYRNIDLSDEIWDLLSHTGVVTPVSPIRRDTAVS